MSYVAQMPLSQVLKYQPDITRAHRRAMYALAKLGLSGKTSSNCFLMPASFLKEKK